MSKIGLKHLLQCRCILPTLKNKSNPPLHKFVVFSVQENNKITEKLSTCNNCGVVHRVYEFCQSEILNNFEGTSSSLTISDIELMLPDSILNIMKTYERELPDYEHIKFILDENKIDEFVVLSQEFNEGRKTGKVLKYKGKGKFEIEPFSEVS